MLIPRMLVISLDQNVGIIFVNNIYYIHLKDLIRSITKGSKNDE